MKFNSSQLKNFSFNNSSLTRGQIKKLQTSTLKMTAAKTFET